MMADPLSNSSYCACREILCPTCAPFVKLTADERATAEQFTAQLRQILDDYKRETQ
jgi:hypothetical protein